MAAFHNNLDLRELDLSNNPNLHQIKPFAFPRLLRLTSLNLSRTSITSLRSDAVPWERLEHLEMVDVWLQCDCDLAWLLRLRPQGARCGSPASLRGSYLTSLAVSDLGCGQQSVAMLDSAAVGSEVVMVGLGCVMVLGLVLTMATLCCVCRNRLTNCAATVSSTEPAYKVRCT